MTRRTGWITAGAAAVLIGIMIVLLLPRETAEQRALSIMNALATGDADAISAALPQVAQDTIDALGSASTRISDPEVIASDGTGVTVAYSLRGERHELLLELNAADGRFSAAGSGLLATVEVDRAASIGELALTAGAPTQLLPGVYDVIAAPADLLDGERAVVAPAGSDQRVEIAVRPTPAAVALAQDHLDAHIAECTASAADAPQRCGIAIPWAADLTRVTMIDYTVEQEPHIDLDERSFVASGGVLLARVTGIDAAGQRTTAAYRTENWTLRGDVAFTDDDLVLTAW